MTAPQSSSPGCATLADRLEAECVVRDNHPDDYCPDLTKMFRECVSALRARDAAATAPETLREQRRAERKERTGLDVEEALTLEDERPKWPAKGCWMRFLGKNGYEFQLKEARNRFEVGKEYLVEECNVQSWSHSIKFDAMEGWYNGVMFEMCRPPSGDVAQSVTEPSDEWCNAFLKATGEWIEPHEPETECGVPMECEITQEFADELNADARKQIRKGYAAACSIPSTQREGEA
jgi:hypothetical protein